MGKAYVDSEAQLESCVSVGCDFGDWEPPGGRREVKERQCTSCLVEMSSVT